VQGKIEELWPQVTSENLFEIGDYQGYKKEFLNLFGFSVDGVDYEEDISPLVSLECE
jgi:enoyl-[acyl-carrier protein] reductase/trans-2-enoyl-CoA reductase (NAD+)